MDRFEGPLVHTPGDNEWTDCYRKKAGEFDPLERLAKVRAMFFPDGNSRIVAAVTQRISCLEGDWEAQRPGVPLAARMAAR